MPTALMFDWAARELDLGDLLGIAGSAFTRQDERLMRRIPPLLRRQLESPYLDGFAFVNALRGRGDWAAVDAAWEDRPRSTEQVLHPDLYPDEEPDRHRAARRRDRARSRLDRPVRPDAR